VVQMNLFYRHCPPRSRGQPDPNSILSPVLRRPGHIAFNSTEAPERNLLTTVQNIGALEAGEPGCRRASLRSHLRLDALARPDGEHYDFAANHLERILVSLRI
jgi:hypothetical protein